MLKGSIPIGRLFGIALRLHYTWFFIFALVTWSLATNYFPNRDIAISIFASVVTSLLFFGSLITHEMMHSLVAQASGIPVKSITLFIFGGVSQITEEPKTPKVEFRIAIAGPLTSFALGGIFGAIWLSLPNTAEEVKTVAYLLAIINLSLGAFNLMPGFPLDGGRVLRSILWWRSQNMLQATKIATNVGRGIGFLLIFGGIILLFIGLWFNGLWLAFIGWFLANAATASYRQLALQQVIKGHLASEIMTRDCLTVPPDITIKKLVNEYILPFGRNCLVVGDSRVLGMISLRNIKAIPRSQWASKMAKEAMIPFAELKRVGPDEDLANVLKIFAEGDIHQLAVVSGGNIIGMITRDNLLSFMNVHDKLGI